MASSENGTDQVTKIIAYAQSCARNETNARRECPERTTLLAVRDALFVGVKKAPGAKKKRKMDEIINRPCSPSLFKQAQPQSSSSSDGTQQQNGDKRQELSKELESELANSVMAYYDRPQTVQSAADDRLVPAHRYASLGYVLLPIRRPSVLERWTAHEIAVFESAISVHGKKFDVIQTLLPHKSTRDVVEFYYVWKNTSHKPAWKRTFKAFE
jgi:hypothetical protein